MGEIPEDILAIGNDIASLIPSRVAADNRTFAGIVIARAILAERERCAKIADAACAHAQNNYKGAVALKLRREISAAILAPLSTHGEAS